MKHLAIIIAVALIGVMLMIATEARNNAQPYEGLSPAVADKTFGTFTFENRCHCDISKLGTSNYRESIICERSCNSFQGPNCPQGCIIR